MTSLTGRNEPEDLFFPGGSRYTQLAASLTNVDTKSRVVVMACGISNAASTYAESFGCRVTAFDIDPQRLSAARDDATRKGVADLITFDLIDPASADYPENFFHIASAEGGSLTYLGRQEGLAFARRVLRPGGYLVVSDLVFLRKDPPQELKDFFEEDEEILHVEDYLQLLSTEGFGVLRGEMVDQAGWDAYYSQMRLRCQGAQGLFSNASFAHVMKEELELYYERGGKDMIGYLFAVAKCFG